MAKAKTKTKTVKERHIPNSADLKYIGAAIDRAIESLQEVRNNALDSRKVDKRIANLTKIKEKVHLECRQGWFLAFKLKP